MNMETRWKHVENTFLKIGSPPQLLKGSAWEVDMTKGTGRHICIEIPLSWVICYHLVQLIPYSAIAMNNPRQRKRR